MFLLLVILKNHRGKRIYVLNQRRTHIYRKIVAKNKALFFWLFDESHCLNMCPLYCEAMEFIEIKDFRKHIKKINQKHLFYFYKSLY